MMLRNQMTALGGKKGLSVCVHFGSHFCGFFELQECLFIIIFHS